MKSPDSSSLLFLMKMKSIKFTIIKITLPHLLVVFIRLSAIVNKKPLRLFTKILRDLQKDNCQKNNSKCLIMLEVLQINFLTVN